MRKRIGSLAICGLLLAALAGAEEEPPATEPSQAERIERILELQGEIEELLAKLPPEVREALRRRLAEPRALEPAAGGAPAQEAPVAKPAPVSAAAPSAAAAAPATTAEAAAPAAAEPGPAVVAEPTRTEAPAEAPPWSAPRRRPPRERCNTLLPLDENDDGKISAADRYWRYLYVWTDKNADGRMDEREIESAYEQKIREIDAALETFGRAKGGLGEIRLGERVVLDLRGDGFSERARRDDGVLLLDAGAIRRGDGPALLGPDGEILDGFQPFRAGLAIRDAGGRTVTLTCPRDPAGD